VIGVNNYLRVHDVRSTFFKGEYHHYPLLLHSGII
jgi:hypothetical protein